MSCDADALLHQPGLRRATATMPSRRWSPSVPGQTGHQDVTVHPIEELCEIHVHHDAASFRHARTSWASACGTAAGPKTVAGVATQDRVQRAVQARAEALSVQPGGRATAECATDALRRPVSGICTPRDRLWLVSRLSCSDAISVRIVLGDPSGEVVEAYPVDTRRLGSHAHVTRSNRLSRVGLVAARRLRKGSCVEGRRRWLLLRAGRKFGSADDAGRIAQSVLVVALRTRATVRSLRAGDRRVCTHAEMSQTAACGKRFGPSCVGKPASRSQRCTRTATTSATSSAHSQRSAAPEIRIVPDASERPTR